MGIEWNLGKVLPTFKGKGDKRKCRCYRAVKSPEYGMKVVERVQKNRLHIMQAVNKMLFGFMSEK